MNLGSQRFFCNEVFLHVYKKRRKMINTGIMCLITIPDPNRKDEIKYCDIGNYYLDKNGEKCVITTKEVAQQYHAYIPCTIYIKMEIKE